jgi:hypothetical protein
MKKPYAAPLITTSDVVRATEIGDRPAYREFLTILQMYFAE